MRTLKLPNGVSLTFPRNWHVTARYGSHAGQDWSIVLQNKESTMRVSQLATVGKTLCYSRKDGSSSRGEGSPIKRSSGRTLRLKN